MMNSKAESNGVFREHASYESMKVQCNKCGEVYSADKLGLHIKMAHGNDASNMEDIDMNTNTSIKGQRRRRGRKEEKNVSEDLIVEGLAKMDLSHSTDTTELLRCCVCRFESNRQEMEQHFNLTHYGCEVRVEKVGGGREAVNGRPRQANKRKNKKGASKADADLMEVCKVCHRKYEKKFAAMHYKLMHSEIQLDEGLEASPRMRLGQRKTAPEEENRTTSEPRTNETTTVKKVRRNNRKKMSGQGKSLEMCSVCQHHYLIPFASFHYKIMHPEISFTEEMERIDTDMGMPSEEPRQRFNERDWKEGEEGSQQLVKGRLSKKKKRKKLAPGASDAFEMCTLCDKKYDKQFAALHYHMMHGGSDAANETQGLDNGSSISVTPSNSYNTYEDDNNAPAPTNYEQDQSASRGEMVQCGICSVNVMKNELKMHYATAHHKRI